MLQSISNAIPGERILIVEDYEEMREYLEQILSEEYQITLAGNGKEALEILKHDSFDLIISDIGMPEVDGHHLLQIVRKEQQLFVPFLFLTAHQDKTEIVQALLLGVDAYVTKPFESDELLARVKGLLFNNRRRKELYARPMEDKDLQNEPEETPEETTASFRARWLKQIEEILKKENSYANIKVPDLAHQMAVSERTLRNRIKEFTGLTPHEYIMEARMNKALYLLEHQIYLTVSEVAYAVGLEYSSYFTKQFKERFGKNPSEYL